MENTKEEVKPKMHKAKKTANIVLIFMSLGFITTLLFEQTISIRLIKGAFEAGLVGGLADWFAVTVLFRHPLGIPIPHTAILPKNRDRMTNAILNIAQKELLNKESIMRKIENVSFTDIIFKKARSKILDKETEGKLKELLNIGLSKVDKDAITEFLHNLSQSAMIKIDSKKVIDFGVDYSLINSYDKKIYDALLKVIDAKVNTEDVKNKITEFVLNSIENKAKNDLFRAVLKPLVSFGKDKTYGTIDNAINDIILDLKNEESENRQKILIYIREELLSLKDNEGLCEQLKEQKKSFVEGEEFSKIILNLNEKIFLKIHDYINDEENIKNKIIPFIDNILTKIENDKNLVSKIEESIKTIIGNLIEENHSKIGSLIKENLDKMNNEELIDLMENKIGKDLSWIRINGSICGSLIGLLLTGVTLIFENINVF